MSVADDVVAPTKEAPAGSLVLSKALCFTCAPGSNGSKVLGKPATKLPTVEVACADGDEVGGVLTLEVLLVGFSDDEAEAEPVDSLGLGLASVHAVIAARASRTPAPAMATLVKAWLSVMLASLTVGAPNYHGFVMVSTNSGPTQGPGGEVASGYSECTILHVDMDAFFVAVELLERPELVGQPVIVGFPQGRSVVLSASYEARAFGVRSAMPMAAAMRLCPQAVICEPKHSRYYEVSKVLMQIFESITDKVEPLSVDEAFLDVAGSRRRLGSALEIARLIRTRVRNELGITASVGIASTKFVAKIASTQSKPDGLLLIPHEDTVAFLHTLPAQALWGVGAKTRKVLADMGIHTVAQIANTPVHMLRRVLGATGDHVHRLSWGIDPRAVTPVRIDKSIGSEETFAEDTRDDEILHRELLRLAHRTGQRLRSAGYLARTVAIKIRFEDFSVITRSRTLSVPINSAQLLYQEGLKLFQAVGKRPMAVRLIGLRGEGLELAGQVAVQLSLERSEDNWRSAEVVIDALGARFGADQILPARLLKRANGAAKRPEKLTDE